MSLKSLGQDVSLNPTLFSVLKELNQVLLGKEESIKLIVAAILANGHVLIEDIPGVGKTTIVKAIAKTLGLKHGRIQFTNDMLPADLIGVNIYNSAEQQFEFKKGPLFAELVLADELNRATPKTQSALLQAMEERVVSLDGQSHSLPEPFLLIATQNPLEQAGTYPLPESQLDRFLVRVHLGFPDRAAEREILMGQDRSLFVEQIVAKLSKEDVLKIQKMVQQVQISEPVLTYMQDIVAATRVGEFSGLSPRGALALKRVSQAWAYIHGRKFVIPEDIQAVAIAVMAHRLIAIDHQQKSAYEVCKEILLSTPVG